MGDSSKYGYTNYNYKPCCPIPPPSNGIKNVKTILLYAPESQNLMKLNSCYKTCKYIPPPSIQYGNKHDSYDRVLRRRRGEAFKHK